MATKEKGLEKVYYQYQLQVYVEKHALWKVLDKVYSQVWRQVGNQVWWEVKNPVGNKILQNIKEEGDL
jgi:hypothetical protein